MKFSPIILFPLTMLLSSCRFGKPLICKQDDHLVITDSLGVTADSKYFTYLNIHHCISIGGGSITKFYKDGKLIEKHVYKATKGGMKDGNNRYFQKQVYLGDRGKVDSVHKYIHQNHGLGGRVVMNKMKVK